MSNHESCIEDGDSFCRHPHPCGTTTPATQSLLPVTQSDREAAARLVGEAGCCACLTIAAEAFARHRQAHSLPGDVGMRGALTEAADKFDKLAASMREEEADLLAPEIAVCELGRDECLAALTPTAPDEHPLALMTRLDDEFGLIDEAVALGDLPSRLSGWAGKARERGRDRIELTLVTVDRLLAYIRASSVTPSALSGDAGEGRECEREAVDDAVSRLRGWLDAGEQYARAGSTMRLDVFVSIALAQLDGSEPPTAERLGWAIDGIKAHVDDELLGDDLRTLLAALPSHKGAGDADV